MHIYVGIVQQRPVHANGEEALHEIAHPCRNSTDPAPIQAIGLLTAFTQPPIMRDSASLQVNAFRQTTQMRVGFHVLHGSAGTTLRFKAAF